MQAVRSKGAMLDQIDLNKVPRSGFDMTYHVYGTGNLGKLIPIRKVKTLPADRWQGQSAINVNFQPLAYPMSSNMYMKQETFYVPKRITWDGFEEHWTKGEDLSVDTIEPNFTLSQAIKQVLNPVVNPQAHSLIAPLTITIAKDWTDLQRTDQAVQEYINDDVTPFNIAYIETAKLHQHLDAIERLLKSNANRLEASDLIMDSLHAIESLRRWVNENYLILDKSANNSTDNPDYTNVILLTNISHKLTADEDGNLLRTDHPIPFPKGSDDSTQYLGEWTQPLLKPLYGVIERLRETYDIEDNNQAFNDFYYAIYEPHENMTTLSRLYYNIMQPFVGLGSYLDYLGYKCLSPDDMLALFFMVNVSNVLFNIMEDGGEMEVSVMRDSQYGFLATYDGEDFYAFSEQPESILKLRANYMIWYWNYRDQLLETNAKEPNKETIVGNDELLVLLYPRVRAWTKDTFTTALDNTGTGSVVVAMNDTAVSRGSYVKLSDHMARIGDQAVLEQKDIVSYEVGDVKLEFPTSYVHSLHGTYNANGSAVGFSLDMLNRAKRLQKWIQKALIYGNRPSDAAFTHFGVKLSNIRLEEPEYITSDTALVNIGVVMNNTTTAESVAGDKTGNAFGDMQGSGISYFCEEHGFIMTMFTIMPESTYGFGVDKDNYRLDALDLPFPEFAQLSMDAVYTDEMVSSPLNDEFLPCKNEVFGYQGRYYDYKSQQDEIHGQYRTQEMLGYTFARKFSPYNKEDFPRLNYAFIHCHPRRDMFVTEDPASPVFWFDCKHSQALERALPVPSQVF